MIRYLKNYIDKLCGQVCYLADYRSSTDQLHRFVNLTGRPAIEVTSMKMILTQLMISFFYRYLPGLFFVLFIVPLALGQNGQTEPDTLQDYHIQHFTDENGLPQISVKSIARDQRGNIWLATERGVVRFDGHQFVVFDQFGDSYVSRSMRGFYPNQKRTGEDFMGLTHNFESVEISDGKAYLDSTVGDLLHSRSVLPSVGKKAWLAHSLPDTVYADGPYKTALIFLCRAGSHFVYDEQNVTFYHTNKLKKIFHFPDRSLFHFFRLGENLYYLDDKFGVVCFRGDRPSPKKIIAELRGEILEDSLFVGKQRYELFWNGSADQAFVLLGKSLYLLRPGENGVLGSELILSGFDLRANDIRTIYYDPVFHRVFLGSILNGLFVVEKKTFRTIITRVPILDNVFYGQTLFDKNSILTASGVLFDLRPASKGKSSRPSIAMSKELYWDRYAILKDSRGNIWGKEGKRLLRFDSTGRHLLNVYLVGQGISLFYEGRGGRIWIGTNDAGLYYIDQDNPRGAPRQFMERPLINISYIQQQTDRLLWVGTGTGLFTLDLLTRKVTAIKGLENIYVRSLYIPENRDEIWITTYTSGFYLLRNGKLTRFPLDKQGSLASAHCILEDKKGYFWITTNKGLFQMRRKDLLAYATAPFELYYHYYSKTAGFNTNEFNGGCQPCVLRAEDGTVSFPSIKGLVWFVPEQIKPELPTDGFYIDEVISNGRKQDMSGDKVLLAPGNGNLVVTLNAPYFGNSENLGLAYKITINNRPGTEWMELDNQNLTITIPSLEPGQYTLLIRKKAGFGTDNYVTKEISIRVDSHWYETGWFRVAQALVVLFIFGLFLRYQVSKVKKQNLILEGKVKERTEHLEKTLMVLRDSEKELETRIRLQFFIIASISHDIRSPVRYMSTVLEHVQQLMEQKEYKRVSEIAGHIRQASEKIYEITDNIVNFIQPEVYGRNRNLQPVNLYELVQDKVALFDQIAVSRGASIQTEIDQTQIVYTDQRLLSIVIHNLIDNALKVEDGIRIRIYTETIHGHMHLIFQDRGTGMPQELMNWLNAEQEEVPPANYEGLGLLMIKQMAKPLRFSVYVENTPGACIHIIFEEFKPVPGQVSH